MHKNQLLDELKDRQNWIFMEESPIHHYIEHICGFIGKVY